MDSNWCMLPRCSSNSDCWPWGQDTSCPTAAAVRQHCQTSGYWHLCLLSVSNNACREEEKLPLGLVQASICGLWVMVLFVQVILVIIKQRRKCQTEKWIRSWPLILFHSPGKKRSYWWRWSSGAERAKGLCLWWTSELACGSVNSHSILPKCHS